MNDISDKEIWQKLNVFTQNDIRRMLDVEYISELTIAFLNGPQNKKNKLDEYYRLYEEEFEEGQHVAEVFTTVLAEIYKIIPEIIKTRWKKKTDFYTLFLFFAGHFEQLPLTRDQREKANKLLTDFGSKVDLYVKASPDKAEKFPDAVKKYGAGIRASTDLGSRKRRDEGLEMHLKHIWE